MEKWWREKDGENTFLLSFFLIPGSNTSPQAFSLRCKLIRGEIIGEKIELGLVSGVCAQLMICEWKIREVEEE